MVIDKKKEINKLVAEAKEGQARAFGEIYDLYIVQIFRFVFLKVSNKADAEDLSQQVFMKAWEAIERFEDEGLPFSSWLYRIARNTIIDFYRTRKPSLELEENISVGDSSQEAEDRIFQSWLKNKILRHLNQLSEEQKEVVMLRFVEDLSYSEISKITGKSQPALRIMQHRAINKLRNLMNEESFNF